jgi:hypothetical protein
MDSTKTIPCHINTVKADPVSVGGLAGKPVLYTVAQRQVHDQLLARSWPTGSAIGVPLCRAGAIIEAATACGSFASQLVRYRAGGSTQVARYGTKPGALGQRDRNVFAFLKCVDRR